MKLEPSILTRLPHQCALNVQAVYAALKSAEKKAADFLLSHPEKVAFSNIVEFAEAAKCSEATVLRLAKRLGYEGYPELREDFGKVLLSTDSVHYPAAISAKDNIEIILSKVCSASATALQDTVDMLDKDSFKLAVDALAASQKVQFCGVGDAATVAREAYLRWLRAGHTAYVAYDIDEQLVTAGQLRKGDVFIAISHSGRSKNVITAAKEAAKHGATVIAITNYPVSPLVKQSDIILQTAVFASIYTGFEITAKRMAELLVIESLFISFLIARENNDLSTLLASHDSIKTNKI